MWTSSYSLRKYLDDIQTLLKNYFCNEWNPNDLDRICLLLGSQLPKVFDNFNIKRAFLTCGHLSLRGCNTRGRSSETNLSSVRISFVWQLQPPAGIFVPTKTSASLRLRRWGLVVSWRHCFFFRLPFSILGKGGTLKSAPNGRKEGPSTQKSDWNFAARPAHFALESSNS